MEKLARLVTNELANVDEESLRLAKHQGTTHYDEIMEKFLHDKY